MLHASGRQSSPGTGTSLGSTRVEDAPQKQQLITAALALSLPWGEASGRSPAGDTTSFVAPFGQKSWCEGAILEGAAKSKILRDVYGNLGNPALLPPCWVSEQHSALDSSAVGNHKTGKQ